MTNPEQFMQLLQSLLSTENDVRSQAETTYESINAVIRLWGTLVAIRTTTYSDDIRSLAAVLLRRLFTVDFENIYAQLTPEQQTQLKTGILQCVSQDQSEVLRRKVCDLVGEFVRNMINADGVNQWPEFLQFLFQCVQSPSPEIRVAGLQIFQSEPNVFGAAQTQYLHVIKSMLAQSLADSANTKIQIAAAKALVSFIKANESDLSTIQTMTELSGPLLHVTHMSMEMGDEDILKGLIEIAETAPKFLRGQIPSVMELCLKIAVDRDADNKLRELCLEVMVTLCETAPAMVRKVGSKYIPSLIQECLKMMTEIEHDEEEWTNNEDEEDDDNDDIAVTAESAIDRIACGLGGKSVVNTILAALPMMFAAQEWEARHAALMALSAVGEGCQKQMEAFLPSIMVEVVKFMQDPHPRVRYACCNAMGQMSSDFSPLFQKKFNNIVLPGLLTLLESDPNQRVQAHAGAALVNFVEDCPKNVLSIHLNTVMAKLEAVLTCKFKELLEKGSKLVLEQVVTTIASVADSAEEKFIDYYDRFMPCLKYIMQNANDDKLKMLRGKTIECISLVGLAVGREKFSNDAREVMDLLLRTQTGEVIMPEDDPQLSFMISSWARICKILGPDFGPYLPMVMGPVMRAANHKPEVTVLDSDEMESVHGHDDEWQFVSLGEQQNFGIRTAGLDDKATACEMLVCYAREMKAGFVEYVSEVVKLMVPLLKFYFHDAVRTAAADSLPHLLECGKVRGPDFVREMWNYIHPELFKALEQEPELEVFGELLGSLARCIETLGPEFFDQNILNSVFQSLEKALKEHFEREDKRQETKKDEDYDEEVEEQFLEDRMDDSYELSRVSEVLQALFKAFKNDAIYHYFDRLLPYCVKLLEPGRPTGDHQWGLCIFDDVIEHGGPHAERYATYFMDPMMLYLMDDHAEVRQAAAYGLGVLAQFGNGRFNQYLANALPRLAGVVNQPDSRSEEKLSPTENCISAVAKILKYATTEADIHAQVVPVFLGWLPVWEDVEEAPHVYGYLADLVEANHPAVMADVPRVVCVISEALRREAIEPTNEVFHRLVHIVRQAQGDESILKASLDLMTHEQKQTISAVLSS